MWTQRMPEDVSTADLGDDTTAGCTCTSVCALFCGACCVKCEDAWWRVASMHACISK